MNKRFLAGSSPAIIFCLALTACGGGDSSNNDSELTGLQQAFQDAYLASASSIDGVLPSVGTPDALYGHMIFETRLTLAGPLSAAPQTISQVTQSLTPALTAPPNTPPPSAITRRLVGGDVRAYSVTNMTTRARLDGNSVVWEGVAGDGTSILSAIRITSFESIPLSGLLANAPAEITNSRPLSTLAENASLIRPGAVFQAGARYFKYSYARALDIVSVFDCGAATSAGDPSPCGAASRLEDAFPYADSVSTYSITDGTIQTIQGRRAWVANAPPPIPSATSYRVLIEYNGGVIAGTLQRNGSTSRRQSSDGTVVDYFIRFNPQAVQSLQSALTF